MLSLYAFDPWIGTGRIKGCPLEGNQADLFTLAELRHHGSSDLGSFLKIFLSAGPNAAKNHLLGDPSAQKNVDSRHEFRASDQVTVLSWWLLG